jgi:hypothetical protein
MSFIIKHDLHSRHDIPASLAREIGRFVVTWANFEDYVQAVIAGSLELSTAEGRIALREPRVTDRLDILRDLCVLRNFAADFVLLADIRARANTLASKRHLVAHCIWQKPEHYWCAILTRGHWDSHPEVQGQISGSKSVEPQAIPVDANDVRGWVEQTVALSADFEKLGDNPRPLPSPETRKKRSDGQSHSRGRKGSRHKPRRPASQE